MKREKLLILNEILSDIQIDKFNDYITNLNQDELKYISANKIAKKLNISLDIAENILEKCEYNKILNKRFAVRCLNCGLLTKSFKTVEEITKYIECYGCERRTYIYENIEIIYSLADDVVQ